MRRFIFVTQQVDPEHSTLSGAVPMIRALAARVDEVVVLADRAVEGALPDNCRVRLYRASSQPGRGARFAYALNEELSPRPLAVLVHMTPLLVALAAPLTRPRGVPLLLWFTHWKVTRRLILAERLATAIVTVDERSFPLPSPKVVPIGHGIDMERFSCASREPAERLRVVTLGRTSPSKGFETIVRAAELAQVDLEVRGPSHTDEERREADRLRALDVRIEPPLPHTEIPALLAQKDVLVNNMREGALDKVVYEAAATCMPVLASNRGFDDVLPAELRFDRNDALELAEKLERLKGLDRNELGRELRAKVAARHSVEHWADEVLEVATR
ncbi:MAG TPA: glycosyltransferase family 4 protein [Gaiellaceae bacterium]|nr:glycosyltransferase family 4 protein [Gaiellaceae bacterium]